MASNVTRDHHLWTRDTVKNVSGDVTLDISGDITLKPAGGDIAFNDGVSDIFKFDVALPSLYIYDDADTDGVRDFFSIAVGAVGVTTLSNYDDSGGRNAHFSIDSGGTVDINTTSGRDILLDSGGDITLDAGGGDVTVLQADLTIPIDKKVIFGNTGEYIVGDDTDLDIVSSNDLTVTAGDDITLKPAGGQVWVHDGSNNIIELNADSSRFSIFDDAQVGNYLSISVGANGETAITTVDADAAVAHLTINVDGDIYLDAHTGVFRFYDAGDTDDSFKITVVGGTGATTLQTVSDAADGHLSIVADGHVEFDNCAVGFDLIIETFSSDALANGGSGTGGTHDTDIDFRASNKIYLIVTATMNDMNLIFPATSGNFLLNIRYDGDWAIDSWKAWKSDASAANSPNVAWPGGTEPATTDSGRDIFSFYWDADNEICYGVASLDFQAGN